MAQETLNNRNRNCCFGVFSVLLFCTPCPFAFIFWGSSKIFPLRLLKVPFPHVLLYLVFNHLLCSLLLLFVVDLLVEHLTGGNQVRKAIHQVLFSYSATPIY